MKINLFSVDVWKFRYHDVDYLKTLTDPKFLNTTGLGSRDYIVASTMQSSAWSWHEIEGNDRLHDRKEFISLRDFILEKSQLVWQELGYYQEQTPKIYQSWINVGKKDGLILPHIHYNASLSAVVYIDASSEQGNLVFESPLEMAMLSQPMPDKTKRVRKELEVQTGDVVIFPGYLKHYTMPNKTNQPRISFVANLNSDGRSFNRYFPKEQL
jgi:uncharacterized protein (TIGR02466 family)